MNKFTSISVFVCGLVIFALSVALINGAFDTPRAHTAAHTSEVPVIPMDTPINIETDGELSVAQVIVVPEVYGSPPVTGAGAARRRATAVETKQPKAAKGERSSLELPGETRFSTEAARHYRASLGHSVRGVSLEFDRSKVGVPTYQPDRNDEPIIIDIDMR
jgi:hypothetical protein